MGSSGSLPLFNDFSFQNFLLDKNSGRFFNTTNDNSFNSTNFITSNSTTTGASPQKFHNATNVLNFGKYTDSSNFGLLGVFDNSAAEDTLGLGRFNISENNLKVTRSDSNDGQAFSYGSGDINNSFGDFQFNQTLSPLDFAREGNTTFNEMDLEVVADDLAEDCDEDECWMREKLDEV